MYRYESDVYCTKMDTNVLSCTKHDDHYEVILEDTIFFPEGGGQPCDIGTIDSKEVFDVQKKGSQIIHCTKEEVSGLVTCPIDWQRRFDHMQAHSGEHLFTGVAHKKYGVENVGFHMSDVITVDFDRFLSFEQLLEIEAEANRFVWQNRDIIVSYPSQDTLNSLEFRSKKEIEEQIRIVEIDGIDVCACCGTHVKKTGEIGCIKLLSSQKYKGGTRIELLFGKRAMNYLDVMHQNTIHISQALKKAPLEVHMGVDALLEKNHQKDVQLSKLNKKYFSVLIENVASRYFCIIQEDGLSPNEVKQLCELMIEQKKGVLCMVVSDGYYVLESHDVDLRTLKDKVQTKLQSRGGGNKNILQGKTPLTNDEINEVLAHGI